MTDSSLTPEALSRLKQLRSRARILRNSSIEARNQTLQSLALLLAEHETEILAANENDLTALGDDKTPAFRDRLTLTPARIRSMIESLNKVVALPDPIGVVESERTLENGLRLKRVRSPLGVILMIFEARPNVITEAFSLALKSGNAFLMRGGSESSETSRVLYTLIDEALKTAALPREVFWGITDRSRELTQSLMKQPNLIDVLVPRGGDSLIKYVVENSLIPIIKNDRGMCHVYLHEDADASMAQQIVLNAKTQRPGVCNSMETLLVHRSQAQALPKIYDALAAYDVEWFGCDKTLALLSDKKNVKPLNPESFDTEYLDFKINCRIVDSLDQAIEHIETHGSRHSETIVTKSESAAREFQNSIDAAAVYWNASTRFTDGSEFGLGGELGISTQKLHVRGPVGLLELTSLRWIGDGTGQVRS